MSRRWTLLVTAVSLLATPVAQKAQAVEVDLAAAVELALAQNPGLRAVEERRSEVAGGIREARADAYPQLALVAAYSRSRTPAFLNSPDFEDFVDQFPEGSFEPGIQEITGVELEVSQPLYTFGKISAAVDLAREGAQVAEARIATARLDVALAAAEAYYEVLAAEQALATVEEQAEARREFLAVVGARFEIGEATRLELLQSQATLAELQPALAGAQGRIARARANLRAVLGLATGEPVTAVDPCPEPPSRAAAGEEGEASPLEVLTAFPPRPAVRVLLPLALERRPELADLDLQVEALESRQQLTRADGRPQLELTGSYGREARLVEDLQDDLFDDWFVAVGMRWEFFDGGRRRGQLAQLESQQRQLDWQRRELVQQVRLQLEDALAEYGAARARLLAAEVAARAAREAARVAQESYREGVALQADWLDAQQRETVAEIRLVEARFAGRVEEARLLRAVGVLPTEVTVLPPGGEDSLAVPEELEPPPRTFPGTVEVGGAGPLPSSEGGAP